jgi:hypothetical protein
MTEHSLPDPTPPKSRPEPEPAPEPPKPVTLALKHTVRVGTLEVTQLVFPARLLGKHLRRWCYNAEGLVDNDVYMKVAADATSQPDMVFNEMDAADVVRVVQVVQAFLLQSGLLRASAGS